MYVLRTYAMKDVANQAICRHRAVIVDYKYAVFILRIEFNFVCEMQSPRKFVQ